MPFFPGKRLKKAGAPPGSLVHVGARKTESAVLRVITYDAEDHRVWTPTDPEELPELDDSRVHWVNVDGLHDVELVRQVGERYGLHPLVLEDVLNTTQRPKVETFDDLVFVVLRQFDPASATDVAASSEQVSILLRPGLVLSFQERPGDVFDAVRERLKNPSRRIRSAGADYLAYALMDALVDSYFHHLDAIAGEVESAEDQVASMGLMGAGEDPTSLQELHVLRRRLLFLKRAVWPLREVVSSLQRGDAPQITEETRLFLRDVYDHTIQVMEALETYRDLVSGLHDLHLSVLSHRMNRVMQVLAAVGTMFIPLTFVAGIYGMNFDYMPELHWRYGYFVVLLLMAALVLVLAIGFRRKRWL